MEIPKLKITELNRTVTGIVLSSIYDRLLSNEQTIETNTISTVTSV